jgi:hypothetical protein
MTDAHCLRRRKRLRPHPERHISPPGGAELALKHMGEFDGGVLFGRSRPLLSHLLMPQFACDR